MILMKKILVTGGMGYIGSHAVVSLLENDYDVTIFDNLEFSEESVLDRLAEITGKRPSFYKGDIRNISDLLIAMESGFDLVIHFAGYKNVSESIKDPAGYYENNVYGSLNLLKAMVTSDIKNIVFSSSCSLHGQPKTLPVKETDELAPLSPYARTKLAIEYMIEDFKNVGINSVRLRYFNAAGAHPSGKLGEDPNVLLNVTPRMFGAIYGKMDFKLFGNKFDTEDGTQIRDYVHVMDLAEGHVGAVKYLDNHKGSYVFNLASEKGTSNLQLINEIEKVTGRKLDYEIVDPIYGDPVVVYGDSSLAKKELNWEAKRDYKEIIKDSYNWYKNFYE